MEQNYLVTKTLQQLRQLLYSLLKALRRFKALYLLEWLNSNLHQNIRALLKVELAQFQMSLHNFLEEINHQQMLLRF